MRCCPMCLQHVHYSVSMAFVGSVFVVIAVLCVPSLSLLNNFLSTELSRSNATGAWGGLGVGGLAWGGLWLGCGLGRLVGCSSALGLWLRLQPPGFLGTYPPLATWALIELLWFTLNTWLVYCALHTKRTWTEFGTYKIISGSFLHVPYLF